MSDPTELRQRVHSDPGLRILYKAFRKSAHGYAQHTVANAALNLFVGALAQQHDILRLAESEFDQNVFLARQLLRSHYSVLTGKKLTASPLVILKN